VHGASIVRACVHAHRVHEVGAREEQAAQLKDEQCVDRWPAPASFLLLLLRRRRPAGPGGACRLGVPY
jgi:hypothetical protein